MIDGGRLKSYLMSLSTTIPAPQKARLTGTKIWVSLRCEATIGDYSQRMGDNFRRNKLEVRCLALVYGILGGNFNGQTSAQIAFQMHVCYVQSS